MGTLQLTINGRLVETEEGKTVLEAARAAEIYIPGICSHPDLPTTDAIRAVDAVYQGDRRIENSKSGENGKGCGLCLVEIEGEAEPVRSCATKVKEGMVVVTTSDTIKERRKENLVPVLTRHRHACLTCAQQEGCSISQCSSNVAENERCCTRFGHCELQNVAEYVGIPSSVPKWVPTDLPILDNHAIFIRDYNLCIGCTRCVRACRELRGVGAIGFVYDDRGEIQVGSIATTLEESGCKFCAACVEVCPTGALMDKSVRPGKKEEGIVPCREACPAHVDVPAYLRLIAKGKRDEANAVIREKVPFPGILGRVCIRPCEEDCRRGEVNEPISICALKRYAADGEHGLRKKNSKTANDTGNKVAVVGAGPAGLTAAFYLKKQGHAVTVFEERDKAGGMMRYGIPRYRLPVEILDREVGDILDLGIEFRPGQKLGKDFTLDQLKRDGFKAVFIGLGAQLSRRIPLAGSINRDVMWGVDYLVEVADGKDVRLKDRVIVIGGGNLAVDVALTAMRTGAKEVTMVCLEKPEEMSANDWAVEGAIAEGVKFLQSWGPHEILSKNGKITGMELVHCISVFDDQCAFNPSFDDKTKKIEGDQVILAVGQASDLSFLPDTGTIKNEKGLILVNEMTQETTMKGIYAGGDVATSPGAVIHAITAGRRAAAAIDKAMGGSGAIDEILFKRGAPDQYIGRDEGFASWAREKVPEIELETRHRGFQEVSMGFSSEQALKEAKRCLQCDLRLYLGKNPSPPETILPFDEEFANQVPGDGGVFRLYDEGKNVIAIRGSSDMRKALLEALEENDNAVWFDYEEDRMYTKRESEMIQHYLQEHGCMPGGAGEDELF